MSRKEGPHTVANPDSKLLGDVGSACIGYLRFISRLCKRRQHLNSEEIHDIRVATRRMREVLRMVRGEADFKEIQQLVKFAKGLGKLLGAVRTDDVLLEGLDSVPLGSAKEEIRDQIDKKRKGHWDELSEAIASSDIGSMMDSLGLMFASLETGGRRVRDVAGLKIAKPLARFWDASKLNDEGSLAEFHLLRIAAKRLRYALEFLSQALPGDPTLSVRKLTSLQDRLGDLHDTSMLKQAIQSLSKGQGDVRTACALLDGRIDELKAASLSELMEARNELINLASALERRNPMG